MLSSQLFNLFILFGLINYSYEFNVRNNHKQRYNRDAGRGEGGMMFSGMPSENGEQHENQCNQEIEQNKRSIDDVCNGLMQSTNEMANVGSQDISCGTHWTQTQSRLREGIQVVMNAYQTFITLHQQTCQSIEAFANDMILQYKRELEAIDQMSAPTENTDINSDSWKNFFVRVPSMISYARAHQQTLRTAADCTGDLMTNTVSFRRTVFPLQQVVPMRVIRIYQTSGPAQNLFQNHNINCNEESGYNGCHSCANSLTRLVRTYMNPACNACPQASMQPSNYNQFQFRLMK
ncbi:unnamed protein product [Adineta steineri]|uniref:Uncharacterized protein n=1 Tax=Adineta steineri TaxID=433720 RepID=A0A814ZPJ7_9BILA|nr:unnamed protein product [Adineta steineri]CAF1531455.1 unnamed protein product [Adineta steineri]